MLQARHLVFPAKHLLCSRQEIYCVSNRISTVFQAGHFLCSKQDISCVPRKTFPVFHADISCVPSRTCAVFQAGHFLCSTQDNPCVPNGNGSKIARMAPISIIFGRNRSRRPDLVFRKILRRQKKSFTPAKTFERANERTNDKVSLRCSGHEMNRFQ